MLLLLLQELLRLLVGCIHGVLPRLLLLLLVMMERRQEEGQLGGVRNTTREDTAAWHNIRPAAHLLLQQLLLLLLGQHLLVGVLLMVVLLHFCVADQQFHCAGYLCAHPGISKGVCWEVVVKCACLACLSCPSVVGQAQGPRSLCPELLQKARLRQEIAFSGQINLLTWNHSLHLPIPFL